jgi:hypothetical protein
MPNALRLPGRTQHRKMSTTFIFKMKPKDIGQGQQGEYQLLTLVTDTQALTPR